MNYGIEKKKLFLIIHLFIHILTMLKGTLFIAGNTGMSNCNLCYYRHVNSKLHGLWEQAKAFVGTNVNEYCFSHSLGYS